MLCQTEQAKKKRRKSCKELILSNVLESSNSVPLLLIPFKRGIPPEENYQFLNLMSLESTNDTFLYKVKHKTVGLLRCLIRRHTPFTKNIEILKRLDHPNIMKIFELYESENNYDIITELFDGRGLYDEITDNGPLSEKVAANIIYQLLCVLNYLHNTIGIIHYNITPNSILVNSFSEDCDYYDIKLTQFNRMMLIDDNLTTSEHEDFTRTNFEKYFCSPESLHYNATITPKSDIYSVGALTYYLLSGKFPHGSSLNFSLPVFDRVSPHVKTLISQCMAQKASQRINASRALQSRWFTSLETKKTFLKISRRQYQKIITNIKKYSPSNKLFEASIGYLVHNIPDIEDVRNINKIYMSFNTACNGRITREEIKEGFGVLFSNKKSVQKAIDHFFEVIDIDGDGYIEYEEFARAGVDKKLFVEKDVLQFAFDFFDKDKKGKIMFRDYEGFLGPYRDEEIRAIKRDTEVENDGFSFEVYMNMMHRLLANE